MVYITAFPRTILQQAAGNDSENTGTILAHFLGKFLLMFFVSALLGIFVALSSSLVSGGEVGGGDQLFSN